MKRKKRIPVYVGDAHRERTRVCPQCATGLDGAFCVDDKEFVTRRMEPGDVTICAHCKTALTISRTGELRLITQEEFDRLPLTMQRILSIFVGRSE
jgi:hypothetical protein